MDNVDTLRDAGVSMPEQFYNRRGNNLRVLFAVADLCSGAEDWSDRARLAAIKLEGASDVSSIGVRLLADIKRIFDEDGCDCMLSAMLVTRLKEDVEQPWAEWNKGKGLTQNSLAVLLGGGGRGRGTRGGFGIRSKTVHPSRDGTAGDTSAASSRTLGRAICRKTTRLPLRKGEIERASVQTRMDWAQVA
jgi:hypothetical protein